MAMLFVSRILAGFFGANVSTAQAYIADVTEPKDRAKGMGMIGAAFGLGFTLGPWIGGELTAYSVRLPGFLAAALSISAALFGYVKLREPRTHSKTASRVFGFDQVRTAFSNPRIGTLYLLFFLSIFSFAAFESMFTLYGLAVFPDVFNLPVGVEQPTREQVLAAAPIVGRYMGLIGVMSAVIQGGLIRRLVPRFGETRLVVAGPFLLGLSLLIIGLATSWWVVIAGCALMPFGFGINNPSLNSLVSRATPEQQQGAYLGLNQSLGSLARMSGPVLAGLLFDNRGPASPFLAAAAILFVCTVVAAVYRSRFGASFALESP
jgi:MFS family permease